jgi:hypothetical protein
MLAVTGDARRRILGVLVTLYVSSALIGTRTIYRTVEYFATAAIPAPQTGEVYDPMSISPVIRYEWFFYVFEVTLMPQYYDVELPAPWKVFAQGNNHLPW